MVCLLKIKPIKIAITKENNTLKTTSTGCSPKAIQVDQMTTGLIVGAASKKEIAIEGIGLMLSVFKPRIIIYIFAIAAQLTFMLTFIYGYLF